jgi:hypothetical protein
MRNLIVWLLVVSISAISFAGELTLEDKLKLEIKSIKLSQVTLTQAIETLRRHAKEIDPEKRGINIIVQQTAANSEEQKITLNLTHIPLRDAISYICKSVNLSMSVNKHIVLISKTKKIQIINKFYRVSTSFKSYVNNKKPTDINLKNLKEFFTVGGVTFPKGTSVAYLAGKNLLSMSNTVENQDKARKVLVGLNCLR